MAYVTKTATKSSASARFVKTPTGSKSVKVSEGKGGVNIGTPTSCTSKRAASNLRQGAY